MRASAAADASAATARRKTRAARWRRVLTPQRLSLATAFLVVLAYLIGVPLLDVLEQKTYDQRLQSHATRAPKGDVAIVAIDEKSLARYGRWPWSRTRLAEVVQKLDAARARAIVFDVFFPEGENRAALAEIARLERTHAATATYRALKQALDVDARFARAIAASGRVVLPQVFLLSADDLRQNPAAAEDTAFAPIAPDALSADPQASMHAPRGMGVVGNIDALAKGARYKGHINSVADADGTVRWTPLLISYRDKLFPSADVQAARLFLNDAPIRVEADAAGIVGLDIGGRRIATDAAGGAFIRYHGKAGTFTTVSVADVLADGLAPDTLRDKVVLIGATAHGIGDIRVTPFGPYFPGVEIRANTIQNLIDADVVLRPSWMPAVEVTVLLGLGILLSLGLPRLNMPRASMLAVLLLGAYYAAAIGAFRAYHLWLNIVYPTTTIVLLFAVNAMTKYFLAEQDKRRIKHAFAHYVPSAVVDEIVRDVDRLALGGDKRELTVLFSDIRGFTSMAESLPPERLVQLLNVYLTEMTDKVFAHEGLLDKYIGDAIMAVYGAPIARPDHARRACRTAVDMLKALHRLQTEWRGQGLPTIDIGIGMNTGSMVVGNMGSVNRFNYTVIGDAVNLASRIEGLNKTYGTRLLVSESTYRALGDEFAHTRPIDRVQVRGRREPVNIYEIMLPEHYGNMAWLDDYKEAYARFHAGDRAAAAVGLERILQLFDDPVSRLYRERCTVGTTATPTAGKV